MIYRRFGHLQARILLNKQDELRQLWAQLKDLDEFFGIKYPSRLYCRERCDAECEDYKKLLTLIEQKYNEYGECCLFHSGTTDLIIVPPYSAAPNACENSSKLREAYE